MLRLANFLEVLFLRSPLGAPFRVSKTGCGKECVCDGHTGCAGRWTLKVSGG